jgi:hypothetical protein
MWFTVTVESPALRCWSVVAVEAAFVKKTPPSQPTQSSFAEPGVNSSA